MRARCSRPPVVADDLGQLRVSIAADCEAGDFSPRTREIAAFSIGQLRAWCQRKGLGTEMPISPTVVMAYLASMAQSGQSLSYIKTSRTGIGVAHRIAGLPNPTSDPDVALVMSGIARLDHIRRPRQRPPITSDLLRSALAHVEPVGVLVRRNQAIVLLAQATGQPASGIAEIRSELCILGPSTLTVVIGRVRYVLAETSELTCPVAAVRRYLELAPARGSLLFGTVGIRSEPGINPRTPRLLADDDDATINALWRSVRVALRHAGAPVRRAVPWEPLPPAQLRNVLARLEPGGVRDRRDRAVVLVAWHLALRGGEPGELAMSDVVRDELGYRIMLGRSKTDQFGRGTPLSLLPTADPLLDPVAALDAWLELRGDDPGPVFPKTRDPLEGIGPNDVSDAVKTLLRAAGAEADSYSSHSLRIGWIVTALRLGASISEVMTVTRHADPSMVGYYGRAEIAKVRTAPMAVLSYPIEDRNHG